MPSSLSCALALALAAASVGAELFHHHHSGASHVGSGHHHRADHHGSSHKHNKHNKQKKDKADEDHADHRPEAGLDHPFAMTTNPQLSLVAVGHKTHGHHQHDAKHHHQDHHQHHHQDHHHNHVNHEDGIPPAPNAHHEAMKSKLDAVTRQIEAAKLRHAQAEKKSKAGHTDISEEGRRIEKEFADKAARELDAAEKISKSGGSKILTPQPKMETNFEREVEKTENMVDKQLASEKKEMH